MNGAVVIWIQLFNNEKNSEKLILAYDFAVGYIFAAHKYFYYDDIWQ